jgi:uncharacterized protein
MKFTEADGKYIIKFELGDRFIETLTKFLKEKEITFSEFSTIGAVSRADLAFYSLKDKQYHPKTFEGEFEVTGLIGNSAMHEAEPIIHAHGTLADESFKAFGGHVTELVTGGALDTILTPLSAAVERKFDEETGLKLLDI